MEPITRVVEFVTGVRKGKKNNKDSGAGCRTLSCFR
jgi:hypothetical protein